VWLHDEADLPAAVPLLDLQSRVSVLLLHQYEEWMQQSSFVPCAALVKEAGALVWMAWMERLLAERLQHKSEYILQLLNACNGHWEEICWQILAKNFGMHVNADAFENIARSLPVSILARHKNQVIVLEALLLGQAGLLEEPFADDYAQLLQREYQFLQHKYNLAKPAIAVYFLRMRPACFPTIRLAQLAMLFHSTGNMFSAILHMETIIKVKMMLNITANDYWHYHFRFGEATVYQPKTLGGEMINNILMNTVATILFTYGKYHIEPAYQQKAVEWMNQLPAEKNSVMTKFRSIGVTSRNASDSQSLIELKSQYCDHKRCLDCAIANAVLKKI